MLKMKEKKVNEICMIHAYIIWYKEDDNDLKMLRTFSSFLFCLHEKK